MCLDKIIFYNKEWKSEKTECGSKVNTGQILPFDAEKEAKGN